MVEVGSSSLLAPTWLAVHFARANCTLTGRAGHGKVKADLGRERARRAKSSFWPTRPFFDHTGHGRSMLEIVPAMPFSTSQSDCNHRP